MGRSEAFGGEGVEPTYTGMSQTCSGSHWLMLPGTTYHFKSKQTQLLGDEYHYSNKKQQQQNNTLKKEAEQNFYRTGNVFS